MKILQVIHGYPPRYNAGSEVYTQTLCHGLAPRHEVHVFTREEDSFAPDGRLRIDRDVDDSRITLHLINNPRYKDRYRDELIDQRFAEALERIRPDIVHIGHLNHLSTSLVNEASSRRIPVVFTLHDYWLMCPRGQFMQMFPADPSDLWAACGGQDDRTCAERCYARYFSGAPEDQTKDIAYWTDWVTRRMRHLRFLVSQVDLFIAPSAYLRQRYHDAFGLPLEKLVHLDYGFIHARMEVRYRYPGEPFTFGYIGTHIPAKGIHDLIRAFGLVHGVARLRIWGRPRGQDTEALKAIAATLPPELASRVEWMPEYRNQDIARDVFDRVDAIVVPSVWVENSPLVIHEAQQARVPVITADAGGMAEYVRHEVNGLLFAHRSHTALAAQMQRFVDDPALARRLGARGYLYSETGDVPNLDTHVHEIEAIYTRLLRQRTPQSLTHGPWRITFDTNPDTCNLHCIMCEEHSPYRVREKGRARGRRMMPFDLIERVVTEAVPHGLREIIPSTMGEPLLYPNFEEIIDLCQRHGIRLNLTTNGTFPRLGARAWAERIVPVASDVKISWNGSTAHTQEAIMRGVKWSEVLENLRTFIVVRDIWTASGGNRCRVTLQLTFQRGNVDELADIVRLAIDLGVDRIKGHHLWTHFPEIEGQSLRRGAEAIRRWNQAVHEVQIAVAERPLANGQPILLENFFPLDEYASGDLAPGGACPFLGKEAWVSAVGRFDPCCAPDTARRTLGDFGDLHTQGLMDIWHGAAYRTLMASHLQHDLCRSCNMRKPQEVSP